MASNGAKVALVTGASSGIGRATAEKLIADGYLVYAGARRVDRMKDLEARGGFALPLDVTDEASMRAAVERVISEQGRVDVLVNNAGYGQYGPVEDTPIDVARHQFEVNLFGLARMTQLILPHMRAQHSGTIVNISSMGGRMYTPLGAWYHATKHAIEGFSDCLRFEVEPFGVDVVIVEPGMIRTEFSDGVTRNIQAADGTAYSGLIRAIANAQDGDASSPSRMSPPSVIADTISLALRARRPKTRYVAGAMGRRLILMRRIVGDRGFDRLLRRMVS
jgi:NAD(P)-dependent dehydrogenase (short-subunit alcohol dehydrogenase family)